MFQIDADTILLLQFIYKTGTGNLPLGGNSIFKWFKGNRFLVYGKRSLVEEDKKFTIKL
jgi:hypothetical protein